MVKGMNNIANGCGGKGGWVTPPYAIFFKASCDKHDLGYHKGGNSLDRLNCDLNFLRYMILDTYVLLSWYKRGYFQIWAVVYFIGVRLFGKKYFNTDSPNKVYKVSDGKYFWERKDADNYAQRLDDKTVKETTYFFKNGNK